jgi:hypothetical protein
MANEQLVATWISFMCTAIKKNAAFQEIYL